MPALGQPRGTPTLGFGNATFSLCPSCLKVAVASCHKALGHLAFPCLVSQLLYRPCNQGPVLNSLCGKYWMEFLLSWFDGLTHSDDSYIKTRIQMDNSRKYGKIKT